MKHLFYVLLLIMPIVGYSQIKDNSTTNLIDVYNYYKDKRYVEVEYEGDISIGEIVELRSNPNCLDCFYDMKIKLKNPNYNKKSGNNKYIYPSIGYVHFEKMNGNIYEKLKNGEKYEIEKRRNKIILHEKIINNNLDKIYLRLDNELKLVEISKGA